MIEQEEINATSWLIGCHIMPREDEDGPLFTIDCETDRANFHLTGYYIAPLECWHVRVAIRLSRIGGWFRRKWMMLKRIVG